MEKRFSRYMTESIKLSDGPPARYQLKLDRVNLDRQSDDESKLRKFTLAKRDPKFPNKTVLLVGATGTGKSTLINALVNYVMGVKFEDRVWFEIITGDGDKSQSESQTSAVSVYEIFGFEGEIVPYSLTIIDSPGYGDTRGIEYDEITTMKLFELFSAPDEVDGVKALNALGLVVKASENRLDERMGYVFNSITSLFGKDMEENIVAMITHSDGMEPTNALNALKDANIKYATDENNEPVYFQFNNRQHEKIGKVKHAEKMAKNVFELTEDSISEFTQFLGEKQPQSLKKTAEVLNERKRLVACIENLKDRVEDMEKKEEAIQKNSETLKTLKSSGKIYKEETYKDKEPNGWWRLWRFKNITCNNCQENCHNNIFWGLFSPIMVGGKCTVCTGKCPVESHVTVKWRYVTKIRQVEDTIEVDDKEALLKSLQEEMQTLKQSKNQCLDEAFEVIEKLEKIALNAHSVSTYILLPFLIEKMKEQGDKEKVEKLERMKFKIEDVSKGGAKYLLSKCAKTFSGLWSQNK